MKIAAITNIGYVRTKNQDAYSVIKNKAEDVLIIVCDGIGGNKAGEVASVETIKHFERAFQEQNFQRKEQVPAFLLNEITEVNNYILDLSLSHKEYEGMGTTITGILFSHYGDFIFNVGDSRTYGFLNNEMKQLTEDDSLVAEMVRMGEITYEESLTHPKRHYLTKAIGVWDALNGEVKEIGKMDYYLCCSDGLHGYVSADNIRKTILSDLPLQEKTDALCRLALSSGGYDNITIVLIER
ncbi:MAG: Stp1/IreP family PP2C-type Ser/Thr phosphatase [Erysipelotrichaceae bacterium]|nr:Stp1/IreP family PP2C-type Ser/Thr phosphatase [Erysipelotrichaceae bacterium]